MSREMLKDRSARDQVADIIRQHKDGTLERQGRSTWIMESTSTKPVWERRHKWDGVGDPSQNKVSVIETPTFAFDWEHEVSGPALLTRHRAPLTSRSYPVRSITGPTRSTR
jgi:hypothetical protein